VKHILEMTVGVSVEPFSSRCQDYERARRSAVQLRTTAPKRWRSARTTDAIEGLHEEFK
jgi:hypothetical protein